MKLLTQDAVVMCEHVTGLVGLVPTQDWVTVEGRLLLVDNDPESRPIAGCPNYGPTIKPCVTTLAVQEGYSGFLRIDGRRICMDAVTGRTDGTPPGMVKYVVRSPGQQLVDSNL